MTLQPIPADIWFSVANYLEADELRLLSAVNRVFFTAALDARYRQLSLNFAHMGESDKLLGLLLRLSDPFIAQRVRRLHLDFGAEPPELPSTDLDATLRTVKFAVGKLCQVSDLDIDCNWSGASTLARKDASLFTPSSFFLPIFRELWRASSKSIKKLDLRANADVMQMLIRDITKPTFVESLGLNFHLRAPCTTRYQDIASIINQRLPALKHMSISSSSRLDISFLFPALGNLSRLCSVSLVLSMRYRSTELRRLAKFLLNNESVQSFDMDGALIAPEDLQSFVELLSPSRSDRVEPTNMSLTVTVLTPQLLDFLAAKLRTLENLTLTVGKILSASLEACLNTFTSDLRLRRYSHWLSNIRIVHTDGTINLLASLAVAQAVSPCCRVVGYEQEHVRTYLTRGHDPFISVPYPTEEILLHNLHE